MTPVHIPWRSGSNYPPSHQRSSRGPGSQKCLIKTRNPNYFILLSNSASLSPISTNDELYRVQCEAWGVSRCEPEIARVGQSYKNTLPWPMVAMMGLITGTIVICDETQTTGCRGLWGSHHSDTLWLHGTHLTGAIRRQKLMFGPI